MDHILALVKIARAIFGQTDFHNHQLTLGLIFNPTNLTTKALTLIIKLYPIIPLWQHCVLHKFLLVTGHLSYIYYRHSTTSTFSLQYLTISKGSRRLTDYMQRVKPAGLAETNRSRIRPVVFCPQFIHHKLNNPIMSTTTNIVSHVNVEQGKRSILFRMIGKPTLVGIPLNLTLDGRNLWRLSHFHFLSFLSYHYTSIIVICQ